LSTSVDNDISEEANENNNADNPELCAAHTADDSTAAGLWFSY